MNLQPLILEGKRVTLLPMQKSHITGLLEAAADPNIWAYMTPLLSSADVEKFVHQALEEQKAGLGIPYSVYDKHIDAFVGSTRLFDISALHRNVEIGHTWYNSQVWRTRVNTECKYLLLQPLFRIIRPSPRPTKNRPAERTLSNGHCSIRRPKRRYSPSTSYTSRWLYT